MINTPSLSADQPEQRTAKTIRKEPLIRLRRRQHEALWFYISISPWLIGFLIFTLGPIISSIYLSFTDWNLLQPANFVGADNYVKLLTDDKIFWKAIGNTVFYAGISVPLRMLISLFCAYMLNKKLPGISIFRTAFYIPSLVPIVAVSLLFTWLLAPNGMINELLGVIGIDGPAWLISSKWVKPGLILMSFWSIGTSIVLLLAGMNAVPQELYEAASIDGAGEARSFFRITLPLISPIIFFNLVIDLIAGLQTFAQAYILTTGGPNNASLMISMYLFNNAFRFFKMGYASAIAWILFAMILALTLLVIRSSALWVFYESEVRK